MAAAKVHMHPQMCAPRFSVLAQTWREDDDGTFIVLLRSADHPAAQNPPPVPGFWLQPVPVNVRVVRQCSSVCHIGLRVCTHFPALHARAPSHWFSSKTGEQLPSDTLFAVCGVLAGLILRCIPMPRAVTSSHQSGLRQI